MKKSKTIFVAGCGGMLGESIYNVFNNEYHMHCSDINVNETWLNYLDFRNYTEYDNRVKNINNDMIKLDLLISHALKLRPDEDRISRADGKVDARKD